MTPHTTRRTATGPTLPRRSTSLLVLAACVLFSLSLAGCPLQKPMAPPMPPPGSAEASLLQQAEAAWTAGDMATAMELYGRVISQQENPAVLGLAYERYAQAAIATGNYPQALDIMDEFRAAAPQGAGSPVWRDAAARVLKNAPDTAAKAGFARSLVEDPSLAPPLRAQAGATLAGVYWRMADLHAALGVLNDLLGEFPTQGQSFQASLEAALLEELAGVDQGNLEAMAFLIPPGRQGGFPYTVLELERARRLALAPAGRAEAIAIVERIRPLLANPGLADLVLDAARAGDAHGVRGVALALPLSGPFKSVGWKIMRGANLAQAELAQQGFQVALEAVNTESSDWINKVGGLPPEFDYVGGPLRLTKVASLQDSGLLSRRAFFTFLNAPGDLTEGRDVWRFFASPEDQVTTLLNVASTRFGAQRFAVLYPEEPYGQRMSQLFTQAAQGRGHQVTAQMSYPPKAPDAWYDIVGQLTNAEFDAVFLPGDWDHASQLAPHFLYHQRGDALLLGGALWAQTLSRQAYVVEGDFRKTVFPGPWWDANTTPAASTLRSMASVRGDEVDFWVALGYDFVHLANAMGPLPAPWSPQDVNQRLGSAASSMSWAMAPITWDSQGRASQNLFLFKPTLQGYALFDGSGDVNAPRQHAGGQGAPARQADQQPSQQPPQAPPAPGGEPYTRGHSPATMQPIP